MTSQAIFMNLLQPGSARSHVMRVPCPALASDCSAARWVPCITTIMLESSRSRMANTGERSLGNVPVPPRAVAGHAAMFQARTVCLSVPRQQPCFTKTNTVGRRRGVCRQA